MMKRWLRISLWGILGVCTCTLLVAAMRQKGGSSCARISVSIEGVGDNQFLREADILSVVNKTGAKEGVEISKVDLRRIEEQLELNPWVRDVESFFDNNAVLHITVKESEPVARIFTDGGSSYYIDSSLRRLPLSDQCSARVPMFTSFPGGKKLSSADSSLLCDIKTIARFINSDSFLSAQVAQVDYSREEGFEIVPVVGDQIIKIGDASNLDEKVGKLKLFYRQVWAKSGFEKYEAIDLRYTDQVVATKRGANNVVADTAAAMKEFSNTLEEIKEVMNDTAFSSEVAKAPGRVDSVNKTMPAAARKTEPKNKIRKASESGKRQPKAVMKKH